MTWDWQCAYVQFTSQNEVINATRKTILSLTDQLEEVDCSSSRYCLIHPWLRALVSPQKDDWVAIWGLTDYLYNLVLKKSNFFGVTIFAECPSNIDEESAWEMIVWKDGSIQNWFISDVGQYILNTYRELLPNAYGKMLLNYLGYDDEEIASINLVDANEILPIAEKHSEKFSDYSKAFSQFIHANITNKELKTWLALPGYEAMEQIANIFSFPYLGPNYREDVMASYYDVMQGSGMRYDFEFAKSMADIDKYKPIGFKVKNKDLKPLELPGEVFSLISYQNIARRTS